MPSTIRRLVQHRHVERPVINRGFGGSHIAKRYFLSEKQESFLSCASADVQHRIWVRFCAHPLAGPLEQNRDRSRGRRAWTSRANRPEQAVSAAHPPIHSCPPVQYHIDRRCTI